MERQMEKTLKFKRKTREHSSVNNNTAKVSPKLNKANLSSSTKCEQTDSGITQYISSNDRLFYNVWLLKPHLLTKSLT